MPFQRASLDQDFSISAADRGFDMSRSPSMGSVGAEPGSNGSFPPAWVLTSNRVERAVPDHGFTLRARRLERVRVADVAQALALGQQSCQLPIEAGTHELRCMGRGAPVRAGDRDRVPMP